MKSSLMVLVWVVFAAATGAQTPPPSAPPALPAAKSTAADKAAAERAAAAKKAKAAAKTAPAAKTSPDPKAKAKKEEPPAKIEGFEIPRGARGFLGLQVVNSTFKLSFYDATKKPVAPDVASAVLRWNVNYQKQPERAFLTPSGTAMVGEKTVRPPYTFRLNISLFKRAPGAGEGAEGDSENFTVDFSQ